VSKKARVFNIMQYEYHPDDYNEDGSLKPNAVPLITQQMIRDGLKRRSIKQYAYAWHDKDVIVDEGEAGGSATSKQKPNHVHIVLNCPSQVDVASIAKWFGVPENFVDVPKGRGAFLDCVEYLTHESEKEQAKGKHRYDDSEVVANFDFRAELTVRAQRQAKYGHSAANRMSDADEMKLHVMQDGWTMKQCRDTDPLAYIKVRDSLPKLRLDYLLDQPPCPFRMNIYVDGKGGLGKNALCEYIAEKMFPNLEKPYFAVGNDGRVAFDGYDGEPVIIWDDWRAAQFITTFGRGGTFNIFDTHPRQQAQQAKHSRVILTNAVNIVNSVQSYMDFMNGLAGQYTGKDGVQHYAEDETQSYRRFPMIMCVREEDFDVLFNRGFVDKDSHAYQQYTTYEHVRGSLKQVMTRFDGAAKEHILVDMTRPVMDCYHMLQESHDEKISDPNLIPEEFKNYGTTITPEELSEEAELRRVDNMFLFVEEYVRNFEPINEQEILMCSRRAFQYTSKLSHHIFKGMQDEIKNKILDDVASFGEETLFGFVFREYAKEYHGEIPAAAITSQEVESGE